MINNFHQLYLDTLYTATPFATALTIPLGDKASNYRQCVSQYARQGIIMSLVYVIGFSPLVTISCSHLIQA